MLDCPRCGAALDLTARDCRRCGADARPAIPAGVGLVCRACGSFHEPGNAWCTACGQPLGAAASATPGADARASVLVPPPPPGSVEAAPTLRIVVVRPDGTISATRAIGPEPLVCGRAAALMLDESAAAPAHVRFTPRGEEALVEDLGSRAGTFLRLRGAKALRSSAEIRLGRQRLRIELSNGAEPAAGAGLLVQLWPDGRAKGVFPLRSGANVLGRDIGDVSFPADRSVSARHARLTIESDQAALEDLGSSNGTFVRIGEGEVVRAGDQILVGSQLLRVETIA